MLVNIGFSNQLVSIKVDKNSIYELKIKDKSYYLFPIEENNKPSAFQPDPNGPNPCMGSLICYKCCTGQNNVSEKMCKKIFNNWNKGKECNCSD